MTWRVEMNNDRGRWVAMSVYGKLGALVGLTRDEAVDRASRLPRCGGRYSYRVIRGRRRGS